MRWASTSIQSATWSPPLGRSLLRTCKRRISVKEHANCKVPSWLRKRFHEWSKDWTTSSMSRPSARPDSPWAQEAFDGFDPSFSCGDIDEAGQVAILSLLGVGRQVTGHSSRHRFFFLSSFSNKIRISTCEARRERVLKMVLLRVFFSQIVTSKG